MRKLIRWCILISLLTPVAGYAQQNNIWYFGKGAGLSFNASSNPAVPFTITDNAMLADEGTAVMADISGALLFYTNGGTVYNKNHQVMKNGTGLLGHVSAFQSAVIVPQPGNDSIYYIFTSDAFENNYTNGYRYSVVNMKREAGLGEVITRNTLLSAPASERLTAVRHANGADVWVITNEYFTNRFRAWLVTCTGVQPNPVISDVGQALNQHAHMGIGSLKASPDGRLLCQTHFPEGDLLGNTNNFFQLFDFNNSTGQLSNVRMIAVPAVNYYAAEFSPDSRLLYVTRTTNSFTDQFECGLGTAAAITASRISLPSLPGYFGLQLGPDKKIYITGQKFKLGVINNPDVKGTGCNLIPDAVNLGSVQAGLNLPSSINDASVDPLNGIRYQYLDSCSGRIQFQATTVMGGTLQYFWDFGDGQTSTAQNPVHTFTPPGAVYNVRLRITSTASCGYIEKAQQVIGSGFSVAPAFSMVIRCDSGFVRFVNRSRSSNDTLVQYAWDFGDGQSSTDKNPVHAYSNSGNYTVTLRMTSPNPCMQASVNQVLDLNQVNVQAPPDMTIDFGETVTLNPVISGNAATILWTPSTWLTNPSIANPSASPQLDTAYVISVRNGAGCEASDTVRIKVRQANDIFVPTGFTPNNDGKNDVIRPLYGPAFSIYEFSVFTRWGQQVFSSDGGAGWDGKNGGSEMPAGVYVYIVRARKRDGTEVMKKGSFALIR